MMDKETKKILNEINSIRESLDNLLLEVKQDVLYHLTTPEKLYNILKKNYFTTSSAVLNGYDNEINRGRLYYFSTTRSPTSQFGKSKNVTLELDKEKLKHRYKIIPVFYFYTFATEVPRERHSHDEMEDRIITNKTTIPDAAQYIKAIHIDRSYNSYKFAQGDPHDAILALANQKKIPVYFYNEDVGSKYDWIKNPFRLLDKRKGAEFSGDKTYYEKIKPSAYDFTQPDSLEDEEFMNFALVFSYKDKKNEQKLLKHMEEYAPENVATFKKALESFDETKFRQQEYLKPMSLRYVTEPKDLFLKDMLSKEFIRYSVDDMYGYVKEKLKKQ